MFVPFVFVSGTRVASQLSMMIQEDPTIYIQQDVSIFGILIRRTVSILLATFCTKQFRADYMSCLHFQFIS